MALTIDTNTNMVMSRDPLAYSGSFSWNHRPPNMRIAYFCSAYHHYDCVSYWLELRTPHCIRWIPQIMRVGCDKWANIRIACFVPYAHGYNTIWDCAAEISATASEFSFDNLTEYNCTIHMQFIWNLFGFMLYANWLRSNSYIWWNTVLNFNHSLPI